LARDLLSAAPVLRTRLFLLAEMVRRDFQSRYAGSVLGGIWSFVHPIWLLCLYGFVFGLILKVPLGGGDRPASFALYLFAGLLPWTALHEGVVRSTTAVADGAAVLKKIRLPAELLVFSAVLSPLIHQAIAGAAFVVILAALGGLPWREMAWLLVAVPAQVGLTLGLGLITGGLHVFLRDTAQVLPLVMGGWFYLTPIVYPLEMVPERWRGVLQLNPMTTIVGLYRHSFLAAAPPSGAALLLLFGGVAAILALGFMMFRRLQPLMVDEV
jgi:lipopolysaccharide transport system permease protein